MVSFQCHACSDVVKKPKLDAHHGRCHSGFDCIDCHTTFNSPAEYKGHTSCITEAEKHQKSLYKGPKTVRPIILSFAGRSIAMSRDKIHRLRGIIIQNPLFLLLRIILQVVMVGTGVTEMDLDGDDPNFSGTMLLVLMILPWVLQHGCHLYLLLRPRQ